MLKVMEKKNNDKGELIDRTAWFTRLTGSPKLVQFVFFCRCCCILSETLLPGLNFYLVCCKFSRLFYLFTEPTPSLVFAHTKSFWSWTRIMDWKHFSRLGKNQLKIDNNVVFVKLKRNFIQTINALLTGWCFYIGS